MSFLRPASRQDQRFLNPVPTHVGDFKTMLKVLPRFFTNTRGRTPSAPLGPFRTDPELYLAPPSAGLRVTWFGHSSLLLELDGIRILIDPVWDERASPTSFFGPKRFFPPTLPLAHLPALDAILISHDHYDHLGESTIRSLAQLQPQARWITSLQVAPILQNFGVQASQIQELDWTDQTVLSNSGSSCQITSLPARHFSGRSLNNRFHTLWASFVFRSSSHTVYYGADSGYWPGFTEIGRSYGPFDLTLLEIGAFDQLWHEIHLGPEGAIRAFQDLGASGLLMPVHWGLFDLALHRWRQPIQQLEQLAIEHDLPLWSPQPGLPTDVHRGTPLIARWWDDSSRTKPSSI